MKKINKLLFGTAGIPLSTPNRNTINGVNHVKTLGLGAMELEFVRNINVSAELAPEVKKQAEKFSVELTCHGQYYINLNSHDKDKKEASIKRVLNAARRAYECGAWSMTFHPAYLQGDSSEKVYGVVKKVLKEIVKTLKDEGVNIWVRPETTGKKSQFGSLTELLKLSQDLDWVMPTIDFAHLHARDNGALKTFDDYSNVLASVEKHLGRKGLQNMHIHYAGINYSDKGELNHLNLEDSDMNYKAMVTAWQEYKIKGVAVCESPNIESDALLVKKEYDSQGELFDDDYQESVPEYRSSQKAKGEYSHYKTGGAKRTQ